MESEWKRIFAWFPVRVQDSWFPFRWMCFVEARWYDYSVPYTISMGWEYRTCKKRAWYDG